MNRQDCFNIIHDRLGRLATEADLAADETSYGYSLDYALRALIGSTDIVSVPVEQYNELLDLAEQEVLRKLHRHYTLLVDISVGPRKEMLNQVTQTVEKLLGPGPVVTRDSLYPALASGISIWPIDWWLRNYED